MFTFLYKMASPKTFYEWSGKMIPGFAILMFILFLYGLVAGLFFAPADYQQGDAFRIIYIHVPSAFMSLAIYAFMTFCALLVFVWQIKLADIMMMTSARIGGWFTLLALVTGAIWGKPMWGTWWIWDARLTSELILGFIYLGVIALYSAIPERQRASKITAIFVMLGFIDIPLIHYSVNWWNTLHQGPTLSKFAAPSMDSTMLYPLLAMIAAFSCYFATVLLMRARTELLRRESHSHWVKAYYIK